MGEPRAKCIGGLHGYNRRDPMLTNPAPPLTNPPAAAPPWPQRLGAAWRQHRGWLWSDVLVVFVLTRVALVLVALLAQGVIPASATYPLAGAAERGWHFTPVYLVDVWARWDSGWYFDLIAYGYTAPADLTTTQSNLGFFPLYPYFVRAFMALVPAALRSPGLVVLLGVLVSNGFLLGGLALLRAWVARLTGDPAVARRTVLYLLLFPMAFFFSAVYTESAFLFCAAAALYAGQRRAWGWAGAAGALLTLARPLGILIAVPLAWQYAEAAGWQWRRLRWDAAWFLLQPAAFAAFSLWLYTLTGDLLVTVHVRQAWARGLSAPWVALFNSNEVYPWVTPLEQVLTVVFIGAALWLLRRRATISLGLYALLLIAPPLFTGQLTSTARYYVVVVPVFVALAQWSGRYALLDRALTILLPMTQALYFALWCRFYWVA